MTDIMRKWAAESIARVGTLPEKRRELREFRQHYGLKDLTLAAGPWGQGNRAAMRRARLRFRNVRLRPILTQVISLAPADRQRREVHYMNREVRKVRGAK